MGGQGSGRPKIYVTPTAPITDLDRLYAIAKERGIPTRAKLCEFLAKETSYSKKPYLFSYKLSNMNFTYGDIIMIANALEMTAAEFVAVWFPNIFQVDEDGITRVHVPPDMLKLLRERQYNNWQRSAKRNEKKKEKQREEREKVAEETAEFLKTLE